MSSPHNTLLFPQGDLQDWISCPKVPLGVVVFSGADSDSWGNECPFTEVYCRWLGWNCLVFQLFSHFELCSLFCDVKSININQFGSLSKSVAKMIEIAVPKGPGHLPPTPISSPNFLIILEVVWWNSTLFELIKNGLCWRSCQQVEASRHDFLLRKLAVLNGFPGEGFVKDSQLHSCCQLPRMNPFLKIAMYCHSFHPKKAVKKSPAKITIATKRWTTRLPMGKQTKTSSTQVTKRFHTWTSHLQFHLADVGWPKNWRFSRQKLDVYWYALQGATCWWNVSPQMILAL